MKLLVGPGLRDPKGNEAFLVKALRKVADVRTFGPDAPDFEAVLRELPLRWSPDAILVRDAEFYKIPRGLERAPMPVFALIGDYNLSMSSMLPILGCFDHFFCDTKGVRIFKKLGFLNGEFFCLYGYDPEVHRDYGAPKTWDVVFLGNLNHSVQQEREASLYELARLGRRYRIHVDTGVYGSSYAKMLNSAHLVFNRSIRHEANMRFFEAMGCGAVVMNSHLDELDALGLLAGEHYLECLDVGEALDCFFEHWDDTQRNRIRLGARSVLPHHSYDKRAADLVEKLRSTPVDISRRSLSNLERAEIERRWVRHHADSVPMPGGKCSPPYDPVLVGWQKHLVEHELEIKNFDFQFWFWWADLLAASGLYQFMGEFLIQQEALLSVFGCYDSIAVQLRRKLNELIYGFSG
jgi:hypothetical protein